MVGAGPCPAGVRVRRVSRRPPEPWGQGMIVRIARGGLRDFWDNNERMVSGQMGFVEQSLWVATMTVVFAVMMAALWIVAR